MFIITLEELFKLCAAILVGALIGAEREFRDKAAGFRTIIFITIGSTLFTVFSIKIGTFDQFPTTAVNIVANPTRIAANIVTGIGFLGAGAILHQHGRVAGLTTASTIWLAAAMGMGIGAEQYALVAIGTIAAMIVLWIFPYFERWIDNFRHVREYEIVVPLKLKKADKLIKLFEAHSIRVYEHTRMKSGDTIVTRWRTYAKPTKHQEFANQLIEEDDVISFKY
ncbi:MAG: MgtC/SapB family protein [Anaerolineales bacterium]|nr:MgtC/SapB family protein [Anaerolineales bacterium]